MPSASPVGLGEVRRGGPARRERVETGIEDARVIELRHDGVRRDALEVHQVTDRAFESEGREPLDRFRRTPESGTLEQVGGMTRVPCFGGQRGQIARPTRAIRPGRQPEHQAKRRGRRREPSPHSPVHRIRPSCMHVATSLPPRSNNRPVVRPRAPPVASTV